jgi:hypothetical protein
VPPKSIKVCKIIETVTIVLLVLTLVAAYFTDSGTWWPAVVSLLIGVNMYASGYIRGFYRGAHRPSKLKGP